ncbi:MAG: Rrf2 family transcriptional regulator [Clostridia bacterium]
MKLSTKGRYGLRAIVDMAVYSNGEHVSINSIAERQGISANYLEQVFSTLRKAGLIKSIKGAQGGYSLARKPKEMTIGEIIRALEGDLAIVDEADPSDADSMMKKVIKTSVWDRMNQSLNQVVDGITVADLVEDYKKMTMTDQVMYYI